MNIISDVAAIALLFALFWFIVCMVRTRGDSPEWAVRAVDRVADWIDREIEPRTWPRFILGVVVLFVGAFPIFFASVLQVACQEWWRTVREQVAA